MNLSFPAFRRTHRVRNLALAAAVAGITAASVVYVRYRLANAKPAVTRRNYSRRSGFPRSPEAMRGAGRISEPPADMRTPDPLRPWIR